MKRLFSAGLMFLAFFIFTQEVSFAKTIWFGGDYTSKKDKLEITISFFGSSQAFVNGINSFEAGFLEKNSRQLACSFNVKVLQKKPFVGINEFYTLSLSKDGKELTISKTPNAKAGYNKDEDKIECTEALFGKYISNCPTIDFDKRWTTIKVISVFRSEIGNHFEYLEKGKKKSIFINANEKQIFQEKIGKTIKVQVLDFQRSITGFDCYKGAHFTVIDGQKMPKVHMFASPVE